MKRSLTFVVASLALLALASLLFAQGKPHDSYGKVDKAEVVVKQVKPNQFSLELTWDNDQELFAYTFPLVVKGKDFKMHYDSVSWKGRAEGFAVKSVNPQDSLQQVLIGFFADLSGKNKPMVVGKGTVATLFFTADGGGAKKLISPCEVMIDTTWIFPSNALAGVTPDGQGTIKPAFGVARYGADNQPCK